MFFYLSKIFWIFLNPVNLALILLLLGGVLYLCSSAHYLWRMVSRWVIGVGIALCFCIGYLPVGYLGMMVLEDRVERPVYLPDQVDGIIVLGGAVEFRIADNRGIYTVNDAAERVLGLMELRKVYPDATVIYTSGTPEVIPGDLDEASAAKTLLETMGVETDGIIFESQSRNTYENATYSKVLAQPAAGQNWILVTSAFHMPRAVGIFQKQGWDVIPYPVDYRVESPLSFKDMFGFDVAEKLYYTRTATREFMGLLAYWLTGKTSALFPFYEGVPE